MATKPRNSRRVVIEELRQLKKYLELWIGFWNVRGTVYIDPADRIEPSQWRRKRETNEYPEADPANWKALAENAEAMADRFSALARYARRRAGG